VSTPAEAEDPVAAFRRAVQQRDAAFARVVLTNSAEARAAVNAPLFGFNAPALFSAAAAGNTALVDVLLEFGADPNRRTDWWAGGFHVLHSARGPLADLLIERGAVPDACGAAQLDRIDLLRSLLDADPERVHERGGDGQTPLHFARSRDVVDLLLERGADIDAKDVDHRSTPAQWMLEGKRGVGRYELAAYLVERGAAADIFLAAALGLTDRLREIIAADPRSLDLRTKRGEYGEKPPSSFHIYTWTIGEYRSPLQVAAQFEQTEALALLLEHATPRQRFLAACATASADEARAILADHPNLVAELGTDDLRLLPDAAWNADSDAVALMLDLGFDPKARGQNGGTALHCAAWEGDVASVRALLAHPAAAELIALKDPSFGGTPLDWCCHGALHCGSPHADHVAVARLLVEAGVDPAPYRDGAPASLRAALGGGA
jgi:ankyrin repeat protein